MYRVRLTFAFKSQWATDSSWRETASRLELSASFPERPRFGVY